MGRFKREKEIERLFAPRTHVDEDGVEWTILKEQIRTHWKSSSGRVYVTVYSNPDRKILMDNGVSEKQIGWLGRNIPAIMNCIDGRTDDYLVCKWLLVPAGSPIFDSEGNVVPWEDRAFRYKQTLNVGRARYGVKKPEIPADPLSFGDTPLWWEDERNKYK